MSVAIAVFSFMFIFALLIALAVYDCKHYILPDILNAMVAVTFFVFHIATHWSFITPTSAALGALAGGGLLLVIRTAAIRYYNEDALGLGDVKLMAAAGVGLGFPNILLALSIGAGLGMVHGLGMGLKMRRAGGKVDFAKVNVPAGLGLCGGIAIVMVMSFGIGWMR